MEKLFQYVWMAGLSLAVILYTVEAKHMSETELVRWSYVWLPIIIFGAVGTFAQNRARQNDYSNPFRHALISAIRWTLSGTVLLVFFYEAIWPSL